MKRQRQKITVGDIQRKREFEQEWAHTHGVNGQAIVPVEYENDLPAPAEKLFDNPEKLK